MSALDFPEILRQSSLFKTAPDALHKPLPGFEMTGDSFKSRDAHANLQVTFMRDKGNGALAADIDIDESSGIEHGFEVIRNATFKSRTNPFLIHEFLLTADPSANHWIPATSSGFDRSRPAASVRCGYDRGVDYPGIAALIAAAVGPLSN